MKNLIKLFLAVTLITGFTACSSDEGNCTTQAYKVYVGEGVALKSKTLLTEIPSALVEDIYVDGDAIVNGGFNTNGYDVEVTGNLTVQGGMNLSNNTTLSVYSNITVNGGVNLNQGVIRCNSIDVNGGLNGAGDVYYCSYWDVSGTVNDNQSTSVFILNCDTLSDGNSDYSLVEVPCSYLGRTVEGYKYLSVN